MEIKCNNSPDIKALGICKKFTKIELNALKVYETHARIRRRTTANGTFVLI